MSSTLQIAGEELDVPAYGELLRRFAPKVIETIVENRRAVTLLEQLIDQPERTPEELALIDLLGGLIHDFERKAFPTEPATPLERLQFLLESNGLKAVDIADLMGGAPRVSAVLTGKREISKEQARRLGGHFGVPPAMFIY